jgi:hypothetical protein
MLWVNTTFACPVLMSKKGPWPLSLVHVYDADGAHQRAKPGWDVISGASCMVQSSETQMDWNRSPVPIESLVKDRRVLCSGLCY